MASDLEVVQFIRQLWEEDPRRFIKGRSAKDTFGSPVRADHPDACSFCLSGALTRYAGRDTTQRKRLVDLVKRFLPNNYREIPNFNDSPRTTVEDACHVLKSVELHLKHST